MIEEPSIDLWLAALIVICCLAMSAFFSAGESLSQKRLLTSTGLE